MGMLRASATLQGFELRGDQGLVSPGPCPAKDTQPSVMRFFIVEELDTFKQNKHVIINKLNGQVLVRV